MTNLFIMVLGPLDLLQKITQVVFKWHIMNIRFEFFVKMFVIFRILLQNQRATSQ